MSGPLIFITTAKIKEGKLEDYKRFIKELLEQFMAKEPQLIAINVFLNEDETEMTRVQFHPNAASMDSHMQVLNQVLGEEMSQWVERADFLLSSTRHCNVALEDNRGCLIAERLAGSGVSSARPRGEAAVGADDEVDRARVLPERTSDLRERLAGSPALP